MVFHLVVAALLLDGSMNLVSILGLAWGALLFIHLLELPIAFMATKDRPAGALTTFVCTLLFGFTWWLPMRLGIYGASPIRR